jgi:hypothetical protein
MTAANAADLAMTAGEYATLATSIKVGSAEVDKAVEIAGVSGGDLDKGLMGTVAASSDFYITLTGSSKLRAMAIIAGEWCTFESGVLGTTSASGQIHLAQTLASGVSNTTKKLTINLTKTTGASLSASAINTWLQSALTSSTKTFSVSALKTLSAPATGWTATALVQLAAGSNAAGDALAAVLDPIAFTLTVPVTPAAGGSAVNFTGSLTDISAYNVAVSDAYSANLSLTHGSDTLTLKLKPGKISSHTTSIMTGLVAGANDLARRRLKASSPYSYQLPADAASSVVDLIGAASPVGISDDLSAQHARLATDPTAGSTDTLREVVSVLLAKLDGTATVVQTALAAQLARLATDPTAGSTDTVKEVIDVLLAKLDSVATNVQTALVAQLARLATDPTDASTDTVKEAINVILAQIDSGASNVQTALEALATQIGASSPSDLAADLLAEQGRLVATPGASIHADITTLSGKINTGTFVAETELETQMDRLVTGSNRLDQRIATILGQISSTATNISTDLAEILTALGSADLKSGLKVVAKSYVENANFDVVDGDCDSVDTDKYGTIAFAPTNITSLTGWAAVANTVQVTGTVSGVASLFTCSVSGLTRFRSATNPVLEFTSPLGHVFWIKTFDATGLDASGYATVAFRDDYLAFLIADKFNGVATITTKTLPELATAAGV